MLFDIQESNKLRQLLLDEAIIDKANQRKHELVKTIDKANDRFGATVHFL